MAHSSTILSQLLQLVSRHDFRRIEERGIQARTQAPLPYSMGSVRGDDVCASDGKILSARHCLTAWSASPQALPPGCEGP